MNRLLLGGTVSVAVAGIWLVTNKQIVQDEMNIENQNLRTSSASQDKQSSVDDSTSFPIEQLSKPSIANLPIQTKQETVESPQKSEQTESVAESCKALEANDSTIAREQVADYFSQVLGWDYTRYQQNEYVLYDEDALKLLAESGDAQAMFTLGLNYRWHSRFDTFSSIFLMSDMPSEIPKARDALDPEIMQKSIYWLNQAAYHGIPSAMMEQMQAYDYLINDKKADTLVPDKTSLKIHQKAVHDFVKSVNPEFEQLAFVYGEPAALEESEMELYNERFEQLNKQWTAERVRLNKPLKIEHDINPDARALVNKYLNCK